MAVQNDRYSALDKRIILSDLDINSTERYQHTYICFTNQSNRKILRHPEHWKNIQCRGFRTKKTVPPEKDVVVHEGSYRSLIKPIDFTVMVCGCSFTGAIIWQYETMRAHAKRIQTMFGNSTNGVIYPKNFAFRRHISSMWNNLSIGEKIIWTVIGLNVGVFLLWRVPALQNFMVRNFSSSPFIGHSLTSMFLSAFSHQSGLHLFCNMYVFWSFSSISLHLLSREQMAAVFCSGAMISSLSSYISKVIASSKVPSLGASGALLTLIGIVCMEQPDSQLTIALIGDIILFSFSASSGLKALIIFDTLGLFIGWKIFDHAAYLGGVLFGIWYVKYGREMIWGRREKVMKVWHNMRGSVK